MEYRYSDRKMVIVLSSAVPPGTASNACAHLSVSMGHRLARTDIGEPLTSADGFAFPALLRYAIVTLVANPTKTNRIARAARMQGEILSAYFTEDMLQTGSEAELQKATTNRREADVNYLGVGLYGDVEQISGLTHGLSLWGR